MQWLIMDLAALTIFALCVYFAARNGFVRTILSFISYILALILANHFGRIIAEWLYEAVVEGIVRASVAGHLRHAANHANMSAEELVENVPIWLRSFFRRVPPEELGQLDLGQNVNIVADRFVDEFLRGQIVWVLWVIIFLLLFMLLVFLIRQFAGVFSELVDKIPIVGRLDHLLGGALGAIQGIIILVLIAMGMHAINSFSGYAAPWIQNVNDSGFIMRSFYRLTEFR